MEDTEPSRLRGAYDNFLKTKDYFDQNIPKSTGKCESCCVCILKLISFSAIAFFGCVFFAYSSKNYFSFFEKIAVFFVVLVVLAIVLFHKFVSCQPAAASHNETHERNANQLAAEHSNEERNANQLAAEHSNEERNANQLAAEHSNEERILNQLAAEHSNEERIADQHAVLRHNFFGFGRIFCCLHSCCPTVSTEGRPNQTEEYTARHPDILRNATNDQTANQYAVRHDAGEERITSRPTVLYHRFFRLGSIFCCPRSCYPTVSTENLILSTEEYATRQQGVTEERNINQLDRIGAQTAAEELQPHTLQATSEKVTTKMQIAEQQLLQYLLSSTEDQESPSSEYPQC